MYSHKSAISQRLHYSLNQVVSRFLVEAQLHHTCTIQVSDPDAGWLIFIPLPPRHAALREGCTDGAEELGAFFSRHVDTLARIVCPVHSARLRNTCRSNVRPQRVQSQLTSTQQLRHTDAPPLQSLQGHS